MLENETAPLSREDKILSELKQLKKLFTVLLGTEDLPSKDKFSRDAINKAAIEYKKLRVTRDAWVVSHDVHKVIKHAPYNPTKLLVEEFKFKNYFKRGRTYYFNRKDLVDLGKELKKRNINLEKYEELKQDKEKFQKYIDSIIHPEANKKTRRYKIPEGLENIFSEPYSPPNEELVRNRISELWVEYEKFNLSEYVDLYHNSTYALFKHIYYWDRFLDPNIKKQSKQWCDKFNYANIALNKILELKKGE